MLTVPERLRQRSPTFSVEFFPPGNATEERTLWQAIRQLEAADPAFVSVTYRAGGSSRARTIRTTGRLARETTHTPMAHLAVVDHSVAELRNVISWYAEIGVTNILAVRGDPFAGPTAQWTARPDGLNYAEQLVRLCHELGRFCVGVAAFPYGHPHSHDLASDTTYLLRKLRAGADFAIAQLFFQLDDFLRLRDRISQVEHTPLLPGLMPLTSPRVLAKMIELAGVPAPATIRNKLDRWHNDPASFQAAGLEITVELGQRLLAEGAPGLHFYTLNRFAATEEIARRLGLAATHAPSGT